MVCQYFFGVFFLSKDMYPTTDFLFVVALHCPANSHYESQGTGCPATCVNRGSTHDCALLPQESCVCDDGYVFSGPECVLLEDCGCNFEGQYYYSGQTVFPDQNCSRLCHCSAGNMTCEKHRCRSHELCSVYDGERGCYNKTCSFAGDLLLFHFK